MSQRNRWFSGVVGTALLAVYSACFFGGGGGGGGDLVIRRGPDVPGAPQYVIDGDGADVQVWTTGASLQQLLVDDGQTRARVLFDEVDGGPRLVVDELDGGYVVLTVIDDTRVDAYSFDADNQFIVGASLRQVGARYERSVVRGTAAFDGQIRGGLSATEAHGGQGSFAVVADGDAIYEDSVDVTAEVEAIAWALDPAGGTQAAFSLSRALKVGGLLIFGTAIAAPLAPAYAASGVATIAAGFFTEQVADYIERGFETDVPLAAEMRDLAVEYLRGSEKDPPGIVDRIVNRIKDFAQDLVPEDGPADVDGAADVFSPITFDDAPADPADVDAFLPPEEEPAPEPVPTVDVPVSGQVVWQDSSTDAVTGTVDADGNVSLQDDDGSLVVEGTIDETDTLDGTFTEGDESGTVTGNVAEVDECQVATSSGGQGAFTTAHFVGGPGSVSFSYDAFAIPDAFSVTIAGGDSFSTGGLVSGAGSATLTAGPRAFAFVSVSAPQDSTQWTYTIGCASGDGT
jgi:hypothetical protein